MLRRIRNGAKAIQDQVEMTCASLLSPKATLIRKLDLADFGGSDLFIHDLNGDGVPELLWLQSMGIFKSDVYRSTDRLRKRFHYLERADRSLFCLTATDLYGRILWQHGTPSRDLFCSHLGNGMVAFADVDGDGLAEVLALDKDGVLCLESRTGQVRRRATLPADNFCNVGVVRDSGGEPIIHVSVIDAAYDGFVYGNPTAFLSSSLDLIKQQSYVGAGHVALLCPGAHSGADALLIGYQLTTAKGDPLWTMDEVRDREIDPVGQHVDHAVLTDGRDGRRLVIAGSDRIYCSDLTGRVHWSRRTIHPQFCLAGNFAPVADMSVFLTNGREFMNGYTMDGAETWGRQLPEYWPGGRPRNLGARPFHKGIPAALCRDRTSGEDMIVYAEGGWPYAVDGCGRVACMFPFPDGARKDDSAVLPNHRDDDFGMSYSVACADIDGDGCDEVIIHDRRSAWIYTLRSCP